LQPNLIALPGNRFRVSDVSSVQSHNVKNVSFPTLHFSSGLFFLEYINGFKR